jgi:hypothetical protein
MDLDASRGDQIMLMLIRQQEVLAGLQRLGQGASDTPERLAKLKADIFRRGLILDKLDARP